MRCAGAILAFLFVCQSLAAQGAAAFDVASIKPSSPDDPKFVADLLRGGRFVGRNISTKLLMNVALGPKASLILGAPDWFDDHYDIDAKAEGAGEMTEAEAAIPILALLRDRFGLVTHEETDRKSTR